MQANSRAYFVTAIALLAIFTLIYTCITRHDEWALMRAANTAAAISLPGAAISFTLPLASIIAYAVSFVGLLVWVTVVQMLSCFLV